MRAEAGCELRGADQRLWVAHDVLPGWRPILGSVLIIPCGLRWAAAPAGEERRRKRCGASVSRRDDVRRTRQPNPEGRANLTAGSVRRLARCAASRCSAFLACGQIGPAQAI